MSVLITGLYQMLQAGCMNFNLQQDFIYLMESIQKAVTPYEIHQVGQRSQVGNFHSLWRIYFMLCLHIERKNKRKEIYWKSLTKDLFDKLYSPFLAPTMHNNCSGFQFTNISTFLFALYKIFHLETVTMTPAFNSNTSHFIVRIQHPEYWKTDVKNHAHWTGTLMAPLTARPWGCSSP